MAAMIEGGLWAALSPTARAVLGVIWDFYRKYPDACRPSRATLAGAAGVSGPTVSRALTELENFGLVEVTPAPGPKTHTYKVRWKGIRLPTKKKGQSKKSPFKSGGAQWEATLIHDEEQQNRVAYSRNGSHFHHLPDGCIVRSAVEIVIHSFLTSWKVPHWTDVRYVDLGIRIAGPKKQVDTTSTVDFVVGPKLLIERLGLPTTQKAARKYIEKAKRKMLAAKNAGWKVILVKPEQRPGDWLLKPILDGWANATLADAEELLSIMKQAGKWKENHVPSQLLKHHIQDAKARVQSQTKPKFPQGLYVETSDQYGVPAQQRVQPQIVLMESAGRNIKFDDNFDLIVDELLL